MEQKQVKSAGRVLDILELLTNAQHGLKLSDISRELELPVSSTHGLIRTLLRRGYLERNSSHKTFKLGLKVLEIGSVYLQGIDVVEEAKPVMKELVQICNETINLAILERTDIIYVAKEEGSQSMRLISYVGKRLPAHATSLGKILLSEYKEDEIDSLYQDHVLEKLTPKTVCDLNQLKGELELIRQKGYGYDNEESTEGLKCMGAPIFNHENKIVAALSISIPTVRLDNRKMEETITLVQDAGRQISRKIGWSGSITPTAVQ
ncbi:MAG: IclR family transcriptional regulator [Acidobacteriota bacterium]